MTLPGRAAVIGLGLMGGSLARDLAALGVEVWGHDRDAAAARDAREAGVLAGTLPDSLDGVQEADLVVLAVPVGEAVALLEQLAPRASAASFVTDLGSTKGTVGAAAQRLGLGPRFVGSHPLAGDHRSGWAASRPGLFAGARVFLCPTASTVPAAAEAVRALWLRLGALPEVMDAGAHDLRLAWTSHLPQVAASALGGALAAHGVPRAELGPGGLDTTRLAGSSPAMWTAIALDNAGPLDAAAGAMIERLDAFRHALRSRDAERVERLFATARAWHLGEDRGS